jgi:hypothetical protein
MTGATPNPKPQPRKENDMTERTVTMQKLRAILTREDRISTPIFTDIMAAAFPIPFTPKKGEIIQVSDFKDFANLKVRVFSHMDADMGTYECFGDGCYVGTANNTITWLFAQPQTPTQKGEG